MKLPFVVDSLGNIHYTDPDSHTRLMLSKEAFDNLCVLHFKNLSNLLTTSEIESLLKRIGALDVKVFLSTHSSHKVCVFIPNRQYRSIAPLVNLVAKKCVGAWLNLYTNANFWVYGCKLNLDVLIIRLLYNLSISIIYLDLSEAQTNPYYR